MGNAFDEPDVKSWFERIARLDDRVLSADFVIEPKLDGLTVVLHYLGGVFVPREQPGRWSNWWKRLPGNLPHNSLSSIENSRSEKMELKYQKRWLLRGEVFMYLQAFEGAKIGRWKLRGKDLPKSSQYSRGFTEAGLNLRPDRYTTAIFINL